MIHREEGKLMTAGGAASGTDESEKMNSENYELVTVIHLPSGKSCKVRREGARPSNAVRRARLMELQTVVEELLATVCCGVLCAVTTGVDYLGHAVAVVQADRVVNDHPDYLVLDELGNPARVGYFAEVLLPVCPAHNGSSLRELVREELDAAAFARLDRFVGWS